MRVNRLLGLFGCGWPIIAWPFDGGGAPDTASVRMNPEEPDAYLFLPLDGALPKLAPRTGRRLKAAWTARRSGRPACLEGVD